MERMLKLLDELDDLIAALRYVGARHACRARLVAASLVRVARQASRKPYADARALQRADRTAC